MIRVPRGLPIGTLITVLAVATFVAGVSTVYMGDDLANIWGGDMLGSLRARLFTFPGRLWLTTNGRMANFITLPLLYDLPQWLVALLNALVTGALYLGAVLAVTGRRPGYTALSVLTLAALAFGLPWWDQTWLFNVSVNYVWAAAISLWLLLPMLNADYTPGRWARVAMCVAGLIAGWMHEASGWALFIGLAVTVPSLPGLKWRRWVAGMVLVGALIALAAPGIWMRLAAAGADDPVHLLLLKSCAPTLLLVLATLVSIFADRRFALRCWRDMWWRFGLAAGLVICMFVAIGGVVGRSGWYGSVMAIIALGRMCVLSGVRLPRGVAGVAAWLLWLAIVAEAVGLMVWQVRTGREERRALELYKASPTGVVFLDVTLGRDVPWWLLGRVSKVPDADDFADLKFWLVIHRPEGPMMTVLPEAFADEDLAALDAPLTHGRVTVSPAPPAEPLLSLGFPGRGQYVAPDGRLMIVTTIRVPGRHTPLYVTQERPVDPGQRGLPAR